MTIESGDGQKFRFYKGILSARSEFFRLMFQSNMKEANSDVVPIPNFNSDVIGSLLLFINKDEVEDISGFAHSLYAAAHIYQLERLKSICESVLINQLSSESIVSSVRLAVLYKVENLLDNCITFLQRHKNRLSLADLLAEAMSRPKD